MITKGLIKNINYEENYCEIELPIFSSVGEKNKSAIVRATISTIPGLAIGYKINDCIFVGFEDNNIANAVILGKLAIKDNISTTNVGSFNINEISVNQNAKIPVTTKLIVPKPQQNSLTEQQLADLDKNVKSKYTNIIDLINAIEALKIEVSELRQKIENN